MGPGANAGPRPDSTGRPWGTPPLRVRSCGAGALSLPLPRRNLTRTASVSSSGSSQVSSLQRHGRAGQHPHLPALRFPDIGIDALERLRLFLALPDLPHHDPAQGGGLLRLLLLRGGAVPSQTRARTVIVSPCRARSSVG